MSQYTPCSQRHSITDPDLAGLLDYLEREMGWTMEICTSDEFENNISIADSPSEYGIDYPIDIEQDQVIHIWIQPWEDGLPCMKSVAAIDISIFIRTYKTLLPVIRDLYSK